ncbi:MAG: hypothetical protein IIA90_07870 [Chloroflexi bacterium]|nr:hypothetical protein [Chloroflexota bacterium]
MRHRRSSRLFRRAIGIEQVYEPPLADDEVEAIRAAADATKELIGLIEPK